MKHTGRVTPSDPNTFNEALNVLQTVEVPIPIGKNIHDIRKEQISGLSKNLDEYYYVKGLFVWIWKSPDGYKMGILPQADTLFASQVASHLKEILADFRRRHPGQTVHLRFPKSSINSYYRLSCIKAGMQFHGIARVGKRNRLHDVFKY